MFEAKQESIKLLARDTNDLAVVSAMLQDAIVPTGDMAYLKKQCTFIMAVNRFCWEKRLNKVNDERVHSIVQVKKVWDVKFQGINRCNPSNFNSILSVSLEKKDIVINFSGKGTIRLKVNEVSCFLEDFERSWPAIWRPQHTVG